MVDYLIVRVEEFGRYYVGSNKYHHRKVRRKQLTKPNRKHPKRKRL